MSKKKFRLGFELNSVVKSIGPTGDEVWGIVHGRDGKILLLRALNERAHVHTVSIPLETYRVDAVPERSGFGGLVEALYDENLIFGQSLLPYIPLLPRSGAVIDKIFEGERDDRVLTALLSHQGHSEVEKIATNKGHKLRFLALGILNDQEKYLAIAKDKNGESPNDRKQAVRHLSSQAVLLEIALSGDETIAYEAMPLVEDQDMRLRLYLESDRPVLNSACIPVVKVHADTEESTRQYELVVLTAKCLDIRRQALESLPNDEARKRCLDKLLDQLQVATWDMNQQKNIGNGLLVWDLFQKLKRYDHERCKKFFLIPGMNFDQLGGISRKILSSMLCLASPEERIQLIGLLRETHPGKYSIPPRAKITTQVVAKVCKQNVWPQN